MKSKKAFGDRILRIVLTLTGIGLILYSLANLGILAVSFYSGTAVSVSALSPAADTRNRDKWASVNPDIAAWLTVDGTGVDFPVMQDCALRADYAANGRYTFERPESDDAYTRRLYPYLYRDYRGKPSDVGSIFLDAVYGLDDPYLVIYGHSAVQSGVLFSDLKQFTEPSFFGAHPSAVLYTKTEDKALTLLAAARISAYAEEVYHWAGTNDTFDTERMLAHLDAHKILGDVGAPGQYAQYVILSTCFDEADSADRLVLLYGVR